MHIFMHHLSLYFDSKVNNLWDHCADTGSWIQGQIWTMYEGKYEYLPRGQITWTRTISYYWTCKNEHIATKYVMIIPLLINQSNIFQDFSLRLSKRLADSDLAVIGPTGNGPIRKISIRIGLIIAILAQWKFLYCNFLHCLIWS